MDFKQDNPTFDIVAIQNHLQERCKTYLMLIKNEYGAFMSLEQNQFLSQLLSKECVKVEPNGREYLANQANEINNSPNMSPEEKEQEIKKLTIPIAHGGRVFEDNIVHFYPSVLLSNNPKLSTDELKQKCESVLIHELFHFFIRPEYLDITTKPELKRINNFTTEGLVDMCARDIQQKYGLFPNYGSDYGSNVIFVREALSKIPNVSERMQLVFKGTMAQIYEQTSTPTYNAQQQFIASRDKQTKFDKLISNLSKIYYSEDRKAASVQRFLYNFSANFKNKAESIEGIEKMSQQQFSDKMPLVKQQTNEYKNSPESKTNATNTNLNKMPAVTSTKESFTKRSNSEIKIAEQIKIKNQAFAKQKIQEKQAEKPKTLTKIKPNSSNNGYINIAILALIINVVVGMLNVIMYLVIK